jgi:nucleotide-binding universal stress UspA family protein
MYEKIIAAYDGSKPAESAFSQAVEIASRFRSEVVVLAVIRPAEPAARVEIDALIDSAREHYEQSFSKLKAAAAERGVTVRTSIVIGHPAEQILLVAAQERAGLIVMGRRGITAAQRWLLGSTSGRVLQYAHCPVLVVH